MTQVLPQVCAVLLAAGEGVRMSGPKGLLLWLDGLTLIEYQLRELAEAGVAETFVVLGAEADRLEPWARRFPRARAVRNS
ncbi:MAG: NTP transferase domain-containing protein, partial [Chloroflexi bacterium]|nr:NTP transferase domain-containing protein [Chloroflexota bacterium]